MTSCEGAESAWELAPHTVPTRWEIAIVIAMRSVSYVVILTDVDSTFITPAIVPVIANWLHVDLLACLHHFIGIGATSCSSVYEQEGVSAFSGTILSPEFGCERLDGSKFCFPTQDGIVLLRRLPGVMTTFCAQRSVVPSMPSCEGAETAWELTLHIVPTRWEIAIVVAMWSMSYMVILTNVESAFITPAVVSVIADWLHPLLLACLHHCIGVRASTLISVDEQEGVGACPGTVPSSELGRERHDFSKLCLPAHDKIVLFRRSPGVATTFSAQRPVVPSMTTCESAESAWPLALHIAPALWEIAIIVAMWSVSDVVCLTDEYGAFITSAVVFVIANWLHPDLTACLDHSVGVRAFTGTGMGEHESVSAFSGTILRSEFARERLDWGQFLPTTQDPVVLGRRLPSVATTKRAQRPVIPSMTTCETAENAWELAPHITPALWEIAVIVAMWGVSQMMCLANVDSTFVTPAVAPVIADWLHFELFASIYHHLGV
jgi:hypothetical protein